MKKADSKRDGTSRELYTELDNQGPWTLDEYGILNPEAFVRLRTIITTCQFKRFQARKQELLDERIAALKAKREQEYVQLIRKAGMEYNALG